MVSKRIKKIVKKYCDFKESCIKTNSEIDKRILDDAFIVYDKSKVGLLPIKANGENPESEIQLTMEIICENPRILIDAAHSAASIRALMHAIGQSIAYDSMIVIFGCDKDKDIKGMLTELHIGADKVIFTRINSTIAASPEELAKQYTAISGKMCCTAPVLSEAILLARSATSKEDVICITGSFDLISQAKIELLRKYFPNAVFTRKGLVAFGPFQIFKTTCAKCGQECEIPFPPKEGRPVYCKNCYAKKRIPT